MRFIDSGSNINTIRMLKRVLAISGSNRKNSVNNQIIRFIASEFRDSAQIQFSIDLATLHHFSPDTSDEEVQLPVKNLRDEIMQADGIIICSPEYVFSIPGTLKNALEWTVSTTVFHDKPAALIVASGLGEKALESLHLIMTTLGARISNDSALLIQGARAKLDTQNELHEQTMQKIKKVIGSLLESMENSGTNL